MQILLLTAQQHINQIKTTFQLNQSIHLDKSSFSVLSKPYIAAIQQRTGADLVILPSKFFQGQLDKGEITADDILRTVKQDSVELQQVAMTGSNLKAMMQHIIYRSYCENQVDFPQWFGMFIGFNQSTCAIQYLEYCSWYVSQSYVCKRWSQVKLEETYSIAVENEYFKEIPGQFFENNKNFTSQIINSRILVENFMAKFSFEGIQNENSQHYMKQGQSINNFLVTLVIVVFLGFVSKFYISMKSTNDNKQNYYGLTSKDQSMTQISSAPTSSDEKRSQEFKTPVQ